MKQRVRGVTLIELMVTLTVLGILLAIAVPSFSNLIANNRASAQLSLAVNAINYARSEAVRRGVRVYISPVATDWTKGWQIWAQDPQNTGTIPSTSDPKDKVLLNQAAFTTSATLTGFGIFGFSGAGSLIPPANHDTPLGSNNTGTNNEYQLLFVVPGNSSLNKTISINLIGRVSVQ